MTTGGNPGETNEAGERPNPDASSHVASWDSVKNLIEAISEEEFRRWLHEREFARNIREGTPYFNGPSQIKSARRHSPSSLLQCQRKTVYKELNAPEETGDPDGIFWFGSRFEEDVILPFLQDSVAGDNEYVTNSLWVDFTIKSEVGDLRIKGSTDPVIVNRRFEPLLLFEIKTKRSVENVESPNRHHKAQAHAYMKGLSEKYDRNVSEAIILYGSRTSFDIKPFHIDFDPWFWSQTVLDWAETHSIYRLNEDLPPATPEYDWECKFCPYQERCGQGSREYSDIGPTGLLPRFTTYPEQKLVEYLEAHDGAKLTPSLAHQYSSLVDKYGVFDWHCGRCGATQSWNVLDWDGDVTEPPRCPACFENGTTSLLAGPQPNEQPARGDDHDDV